MLSPLHFSPLRPCLLAPLRYVVPAFRVLRPAVLDIPFPTNIIFLHRAGCINSPFFYDRYRREVWGIVLNMNSQSKSLRFIPGSGLVAQSSELNLPLQEGNIVSVGLQFQFPVDVSDSAETEVYGIKNAKYQVMLYPLIKSLEVPIDTKATLRLDTGKEVELEFPTSPNYGLLAILTEDDPESGFDFKVSDILYIPMKIRRIEKIEWMSQEYWHVTLTPFGNTMEDKRIEVRTYTSPLSRNDLAST